MWITSWGKKQIDVTERELRKLVITETATSGQPPRVIIVGHSVGAYILLEILRRHRERLLGNPKDDAADGMRIEGGIYLFPTVTHIAKSKSGRKFSVGYTLHFNVLLADRDPREIVVQTAL
jgi:pimeloyl-ACP methyl ester carboxylesterase